MMRNNTRSLVLMSTLFALILGCGGASLNNNKAGGDGYLDHQEAPDHEAESLVGDGRCSWTGNPYIGVTVERAYVMLYETSEGDCGELSNPTAQSKTIWGLAPHDQGATELIDVSGTTDVRLLDTSEGLLLMAEDEKTKEETLYLIDHQSMELTSSVPTEHGFWGTRTSPSRRWVAAGDNNASAKLPIHVIDSKTLETTIIDDQADIAEAMWLNKEDALAAILFDLTTDTARLKLWDFHPTTHLLISEDGAEQARTAMPTARWEIEVNASIVLGFGYSWIGVDPLDRYLVFPVVSDGVRTLLIVDVLTEQVREVPNATGPVAFTPDGSSIVAWNPERESELLVIDEGSLEITSVPLSLDGTPEYFVSSEGNEVLIADVEGRDRLELIDLSTKKATTLQVALPLHHFTERLDHQEVWLTDAGLWKISLDEPEAVQIPLSFTPNFVAWLPKADLLFVDDSQQPKMMFLDPDTEEVVVDVGLSSSFRSSPLLSLAR